MQARLSSFSSSSSTSRARSAELAERLRCVVLRRVLPSRRSGGAMRSLPNADNSGVEGTEGGQRTTAGEDAAFRNTRAESSVSPSTGATQRSVAVGASAADATAYST